MVFIVRLLVGGGEPFDKLSLSLVPLSHHEASDFGVEDRTGLKLHTSELCCTSLVIRPVWEEYHETAGREKRLMFIITIFTEYCFTPFLLML